jgi:hypothetical protein
MAVEFHGFGHPLRNLLRLEKGPASRVVVQPL